MYTQYVHAEKRTTNSYGVAVFPVSLKEPKEQTGPKDKLATFGYIKTLLGNLLGKTLTVVDAAIAEPRHNKAIKDLIKQDFGQALDKIVGELVDQEVSCAMADEAVANMTEEELAEMEKGVDITEVFGVEEN